MPEQATYFDLNSQLYLVDANGDIQLDKDKQAARAFFLEHVNPNTVFFHDLEEKTNYLVENGYWDKATVERFPFEQFKQIFKRAYSHKFRFQTFMGAYKFYAQYALKNSDGDRYLERYEDRVSMCAIGLSGGDFDRALDLVDMIVGGYFQPATPTFLNAGRANCGERVSCFLLRIEDNMESIGRAVNSALQLSKRGGGVGLLITNIREAGAPIKNLKGRSSGPVPVMKILEDSFSYANQLGQRQGAGAVYISCHHPDIMAVLDTKRENADEKIRIKTLSVGIVISDIAMQLAKENKEMYLFSPYDVELVEGKPMSDVSITERYWDWVEDDRITKTKINARKFLMTLAELQFESGYPYILFEDTANRGHTMKHAGRINMSNLCSEILQLNTPSVLNDDLSYQTIGADISCNLGSLNVKRMLDLNQQDFMHYVKQAVWALTEVAKETQIDSVPSVREGNNRSWAIGLGQMNLHGALAYHGLKYGSDEALELWDKYMALVTYAAMEASTEVAREYGEHDYFEGCAYQTGKWFRDVPVKFLERCTDRTIIGSLQAPGEEEWHNLEVKVSQYGMAHAYLQTIPPTGSISYVNNSTSSIHPAAARVEIRKEGKIGRVYYPAPHMTNENRHLYEDAYELGYKPIIDTYAVSQQWIDQGQSLTLFFTDDASTRDINRAQIYAWRKGIKTLYYIRLRQTALQGTGLADCVSCQL